MNYSGADLTIETPQSLEANSTPWYSQPVGVVTTDETSPGHPGLQTVKKKKRTFLSER
jgi:hypothetical protein